ncbi:small-subunit processome [Lasiosphaeris hirsuta]|uniref:U3 small nucleolar RNA-associated protein 11 n=1 Tax=Lasiosphaeris hirsuta TaxID=260670 RepID=A0AA40BA22_9PEZI|nr:small-subunit processome [Lasiosphaeris hirsuta]
MSSLRNSVQRRAHRERAQPLERQRLGLLEKKKDYQKRAKDYSKKKAVLKSLREKVADRNEDEFYFGMMSRKGPGARITSGKRFTGTVEGDRGNRAMNVDMVRLLKTQDLGYLRTLRNVAAREVKELEERFILAGGSWEGAGDGDDDDDDDDDMTGPSGSVKPRKIVFCDGKEEREKAQKHTASDDDPTWESEADEKDDKKDDEKAKEAAKKAKHIEKLKRKLQAARKRLRALANAEYELELQQAKMAKTATSGGITKNGDRIKVRERKR